QARHLRPCEWTVGIRIAAIHLRAAHLSRQRRRRKGKQTVDIDLTELRVADRAGFLDAGDLGNAAAEIEGRRAWSEAALRAHQSERAARRAARLRLYRDGAEYRQRCRSHGQISDHRSPPP